VLLIDEIAVAGEMNIVEKECVGSQKDGCVVKDRAGTGNRTAVLQRVKIGC